MGGSQRKRRQSARNGFRPARSERRLDGDFGKQTTADRKKQIMKKTVIAVSVLAIMAVVGVSTLQAEDPAEDPLLPSDVTGVGVYREFIPWTEEFGDGCFRFAIKINVDGKPHKKRPQAHIRVDGRPLREFWGGPLVIQEAVDATNGWEPVNPPEFDKPGQIFRFLKKNRLHGEVAVYVYIHDNITPGFNRDNPDWSDWMIVWVEQLEGDGQPYSGDELFLAGGVVVRGDIVDYRE